MDTTANKTANVPVLRYLNINSNPSKHPRTRLTAVTTWLAMTPTIFQYSALHIHSAMVMGPVHGILDLVQAFKSSSWFNQRQVLPKTTLLTGVVQIFLQLQSNEHHR